MPSSPCRSPRADSHSSAPPIAFPSEQSARSSTGLYTGFRTASVLRATEAPRRDPPRLLPELVHNYHSQNHEYYSKECDYHGARSFAMVDDQLAALYLRSKQIREINLPRSELSAEDLSGGAFKCSDSKTSGPFVPPHSQQNTETFPEAGFAGHPTGSPRYRESTVPGIAKDCTTLSSVSIGTSTKTLALCSNTLHTPHRPDFWMAPTAFELRRMRQHSMPPVRSVKSVASRNKIPVSCLVSTKRILPPSIPGDDGTVPIPPRRQAQLARPGLSEVDGWQVKMGILSPTASTVYGGGVL